MSYPQCTVVRPKADVTFRPPNSRRMVTFKAGVELWVQNSEVSQKHDSNVMLGKKKWLAGTGYRFSLADCEQLFTFETK